MRDTKDIADPKWQDIIDRDERIKELEGQLKRAGPKLLGVTAVEGKNNDKIFLQFDLPEGTPPYTGRVSASITVVAGGGEEYARKHFRPEPTVLRKSGRQGMSEQEKKSEWKFLSFAQLFKWLADQGCRPGLYLHGDKWRAHINVSGNYWQDHWNPHTALTRAVEMWIKAGKPFDGAADVEENKE